MTRQASVLKRDAALAYGAEVDQEAEAISELFERMDELQASSGRVLVHPFDDPLVLAGQGTVGLEILEDLAGVDTIVVPCGGGGLFSGIAAAAAGADVVVVPVEPETSRALHAAVESGESTRVEARSIADGLNAPFAGELPLRMCLALGIEPVLVSEDEIADAFRFLYQRAKLSCEPAGAAAVAAVLAGKAGGGRTVCVISGGNVAAETAADILAGP
jgi:threonine dehydratase